jgi:hypothetical protein
MTFAALQHPVRRLLIGAGLLPMLCLCPASELAGQSVPASGSVIRISTDSVHTGRWTMGNYLSLNDRVLHMVSSQGDTLWVPRPALHHFEMSEGRYPHLTQGLLIGAGTAGAAAFLVRHIGCSREPRDLTEEREFCAEHGGLEVALIGALSGAIVGGLFGQLIKSDRWMPMQVERFPRMP